MFELISGASVFESWLKEFEQPYSIPGTSLSRVFTDVRFLREQGIEVTGDDRDAVLAWCLGVGQSQMPKHFIYGLTLAQTLERARKKLIK